MFKKVKLMNKDIANTYEEGLVYAWTIARTIREFTPKEQDLIFGDKDPFDDFSIFEVIEKLNSHRICEKGI